MHEAECVFERLMCLEYGAKSSAQNFICLKLVDFMNYMRKNVGSLRFAVPCRQAERIDVADEAVAPSNETYDDRRIEIDAGDINLGMTFEQLNQGAIEEQENEELEATSVCISDARKMSAGALESHFCFVEVMQVRNLWNAWTVGVDEGLWSGILAHPESGLALATKAAVDTLAKTLHQTLRNVTCHTDWWFREFAYPNGPHTSLASLCQDDNSAAMRHFLRDLLATEGTQIVKW